MNGDAEGNRPLDQLGVSPPRLGRDEELANSRATVGCPGVRDQSFADRLRPFGQERTILLSKRPLEQPFRCLEPR